MAGRTLLERIIPFGNSIENPRISLNDPRAWDELFGQNLSDTGVRVTPKMALGYPPLWRGINLIANSVMKLPFRVYEAKGENQVEKAKQHPAYKLLRRKANPFVSAQTFKRMMTYHAIFRGNAYAAIKRNGRGEPVELLPLSPTDTHPVQENGALWYASKVQGMKRKFRAEDVLHIKGLSFDGIVGHDVITVFADALGLGIAARKYGAKFFANGASTGGVLMIPRGMSEAAEKRLRKEWKDYQEGLDNSFRTAVLEDGAKWIATTFNPEQSQLVALRQFEVREVANILNLPPHKLGDNSRLAYNSLEQENKATLEDAYDPWLLTWEEECDIKLLTEEQQERDTHYCQFDRTALEKPDASTQADIDSKHVNGGIKTLNEARAALNLPPAPAEIGDQYRIPTTITVGIPAAPEPAPAGNPGGEPAPKAEPKAEPKGDPKKGAVKGAIREALRDRLTRLDAIERDQLPKAEKRGPGETLEWRAAHRKRVAEAMKPLFGILHAATETAESADARADEFSSRYVTAESSAVRETLIESLFPE